MTTRIEIKNLSIGLIKNKEQVLVDDISFYVQKGETLGIVGESGSGKTLSVMSVIGLLPPGVETKSGIINLHLNNQTIHLADAGFKQLKNIRGKKISVIFQEPLSSLNPSIKCGKQVGEIIKTHFKLSKHDLKIRVLGLFNEVDLPDPEKAYKSYPFQLSGGQQQRLMIAMAIANKPDFIIADEPTTALDVLVQKKIILLLKNLQEKMGMGILFISHDIDLVGQISDRIIVMQNGRIIEQGNASNIINAPEAKYTQKLIGSKPKANTPKPDLKGFRVSNETMLEVKNLNVYYNIKRNLMGKVSNQFQAVKNVTFNVFKGETLGLVGGSGSGKSTIGRAIIHLFDQLKGEIIFNGQQISLLHEKEFNPIRKKIQLIFQDPYGSLNPKITIGQALCEVVYFHKIRTSAQNVRIRALELLKEVKLDESYFNRYPHELSGGQRQRVVIARALALEPELIICDESVSALDVSIQAEILKLLNELKITKKLTYIFISHDLSVVKYMCNRVIVLNKGAIEEINEPDTLFVSPQSVYSRQLLDAMQF